MPEFTALCAIGIGTSRVCDRAQYDIRDVNGQVNCVCLFQNGARNDDTLGDDIRGDSDSMKRMFRFFSA